MDKEILLLVFIFAVLAIPVLGITARLAIKPVVEAMVRLREAFAVGSSSIFEQRFTQLEAQVQLLNTLVARLQEESAFERKLASSVSRSAGALPSPGSPSAADIPPA